VLSGRLNPSGKLPIELPRHHGGQPAPYLREHLAGRTGVSSVDPTPLFPFGHGLSYTEFGYSGLLVRPAGAADGGTVGAGGPADAGGADAGCVIGTDGAAEVSCTVTNAGPAAGAEVVQLYLRDPVAQVVRPGRWLAGFRRVPLRPGESARVTFLLHADRTAFHGRAGFRIVEPGLIEVAVGASSGDLRLFGTIVLEGDERRAGPDRVLTTPVTVGPVSAGTASTSEE